MARSHATAGQMTSQRKVEAPLHDPAGKEKFLAPWTDAAARNGASQFSFCLGPNLVRTDSLKFLPCCKLPVLTQSRYLNCTLQRAASTGEMRSDALLYSLVQAQGFGIMPKSQNGLCCVCGH